MDGWVSGCMGGWVGGWMDEHMSITCIIFACLDPFRFVLVHVCLNSDLQQDTCTVLY